MIHIIGLGPGSVESITIGTMDILKKCNKVFFRTSMHPSVDFIKSQGIYFETFDFLYESSDSFEEVYNKIANFIIKESSLCADICYGVPGNPKVAEKSVEILISICMNENIKFKIHPAVSFLDLVFHRLNIDPIDGIQVLDGANINETIFDRRKAAIICQVYDEFIASAVKIYLNKYFNDEKQIYFLKSLGIDGDEIIKKINLMDLDKIKVVDHLTSIYIPASSNEIDFKYDIFDLIKIISYLRGENGCSWDKKQTNESLIKYMVEEVYELKDAIDNDDIDNIVEELGDVLLNVLFQCQIGDEESIFDFMDVTDSICRKLIYRHPHIFKDKQTLNEEEVLKNWHEMKKNEKHIGSYADEIKNVKISLPRLRATKVLNIVSEKDPYISDVSKIKICLIYEIIEFLRGIDEYNDENRSTILEKLGDVLFSVINLSRILNLDIDKALNVSIDKFINSLEI